VEAKPRFLARNKLACLFPPPCTEPREAEPQHLEGIHTLPTQTQNAVVNIDNKLNAGAPDELIATDRVARVRPGALATIVVVSALLGGVSALALGRATGLLEDSTERVVVETEPTGAAAPVVAQPRRGATFDPAHIYARRSPGVVTIYALFERGGGSDEHAAQGSGFIVSRQGHVLTSAHVITRREGDSLERANRLFVEFNDRDRVPAEFIGFDPYDDVGVLRVDPAAHRLHPLPLGDSDGVRIGEPVAAIGSPFGNLDSLSVGVVSATGRSIDSLNAAYSVVDAIQTDAPITYGNSGGPLLDAAGRVIGINAQIRTNSGEAAGVGFAVPINAATRSMQQLIARGKVSYPYVGITSDDLTPSVARALGYRVTRGALVVRALPGGPAARAGIRGGSGQVEVDGRIVTRGGDVIVGIGGRPVRNKDDVVRTLLSRYEPGETVSLAIIRDNRRQSVRVRLGERPPRPTPEP
jgi:S1-C subfamily serine protease